MRVLFLDLESTGLDTATARITEIGAVLWDVETKRPLVTLGVFLYDSSYPKQSDEVLRVTGITDDMLLEFGTDPKSNLAWLDSFSEKHRVEYCIGHNSDNFDRPLLMSELERSGVEARCLRNLPWLDSVSDIPFAVEPTSRKLNHLALDAGFLSPWSHRACFDALTCAKLVSGHNIQDLIAYRAIPWAIMRANVSFNDKDKAKARKYSWERLGDRSFHKYWVKRLKVDQIEKEVAECKAAGFACIRLE